MACEVYIPNGPNSTAKLQGSGMDLALEGERLCKAGDCRTGVQFFEAAVEVGTDDLKTLSAIYSQLGNAYFYLQDYGKALEYHKHDLNLARTLGDRLGEAKASGNLGNTFKVLGKFDEAIVCCQRHLDISKELGDKIGEARALYNIGNVFHAKGKHAGRNAQQDPGEFPPEVKEALQKAAEYYEDNLKIVRDLGDRAAQGRACGNLGNTHYLLGNFKLAITYHEERLSIAKEFGDKSAERRAYSNLGNAHIFLGEFDVAAEQYQKTLQIAIQLEDKALEAQACYSLGNTYTLLRDYEKAIEYHKRHLLIAQALNDRVGEGRACWSLGNAHTALGNHEKALYFATRHLEISKEICDDMKKWQIGDKTGQATAQMNLSDLRKVLGISANADPQDIENISISTDRYSVISTTESEDSLRGRRRFSMENMDLLKMTPDRPQDARPSNGARPKVKRALTVSLDETTEKIRTDAGLDGDKFFDMITKFQSQRMDEQRCSMRIGNSAQATTSHRNSIKGQESVAGNDDFFDMIAGMQANRMDDQRSSMPNFPGLHASPAVRDALRNRSVDVPDDQFLEMLMRCQNTRLEEQRSTMPENNNKQAPTVPDEDFFSLITRIQSRRLEEQRTEMPISRENSITSNSGKPDRIVKCNSKKKK